MFAVDVVYFITFVVHISEKVDIVAKAIQFNNALQQQQHPVIRRSKSSIIPSNNVIMNKNMNNMQQSDPSSIN